MLKQRLNTKRSIHQILSCAEWKVRIVTNRPTNRITEYEGTIATLKSKLKLTEEDKKDKINQLKKELKVKEQKLKALEKQFEKHKKSKDKGTLSTILMDDAEMPLEGPSEDKKWFIRKVSENDYRRLAVYVATFTH